MTRADEGGRGARDELLDRAVDYVATHGITDRSLRSVATDLGTSHRMLIYHFGSRDGLLLAIVGAMEQQQRDLMMRLESQLQPGDSPGEITRRMWRALRDPAMWPSERLFFELYGRAVHGDAPAARMSGDIIGATLEPAAALCRRVGMGEVDARTTAQLAIAAIRGLLLDLLATGDVAGTDAALERFVRLWESELVDPAGSGPPHAT